MRFLNIDKTKTKIPTNNTKDKFIVIDVVGDNEQVQSQANCLNTLVVQFDDVQDIEQDKTYFDRGMAKDILNFVNRYCAECDLIVCRGNKGISRSTAIAAALSKIMNNTDDGIFCSGIPNMLVYNTLLDVYFGEPNYNIQWKRVNYVRNQSLRGILPIILYKSQELRQKERNESRRS